MLLELITLYDSRTQRANNLWNMYLSITLLFLGWCIENKLSISNTDKFLTTVIFYGVFLLFNLLALLRSQYEMISIKMDIQQHAQEIECENLLSNTNFVLKLMNQNINWYPSVTILIFAVTYLSVFFVFS